MKGYFFFFVVVFFLELAFLAVVFFALVFFFAVAMASSLQYLFTMKAALPVPDEPDSAPYGLFHRKFSNDLLQLVCQPFFGAAFHHSVLLIPRIPKRDRTGPNRPPLFVHQGLGKEYAIEDANDFYAWM